MNGTDFNFRCPHCDELYMEIISDGQDYMTVDKVCEECGKKFRLEAFVEAVYNTFKK